MSEELGHTFWGVSTYFPSVPNPAIQIERSLSRSWANKLMGILFFIVFFDTLQAAMMAAMVQSCAGPMSTSPMLVTE